MMFMSFNSNTTDVTSGAGSVNPSKAPGFNSGFIGFVFVNLWFSVKCFVYNSLSFCPFPFGHCND